MTVQKIVAAMSIHLVIESIARLSPYLVDIMALMGTFEGSTGLKLFGSASLLFSKSDRLYHVNEEPETREGSESAHSAALLTDEVRPPLESAEGIF